jgi:hypothetical protein
MVERAFGVLQSRFTIVRGPARFWDEETLSMIMTACVIMHNMIVKDEGFMVDHNERFEDGDDNVEPDHGRAHRTLVEFIEAHKKIQDKETHVQLKEDLIEHLWNRHPDLYWLIKNVFAFYYLCLSLMDTFVIAKHDLSLIQYEIILYLNYISCVCVSVKGIHAVQSSRDQAQILTEQMHYLQQ